MSRFRRSPVKTAVLFLCAALVVLTALSVGPDEGGQAQGPAIHEPRAAAQGLRGAPGHEGRVEVQGPQVAVPRPDQHQRPGHRRRRRRPPGKNYTIYVATASGGLWKTENEAHDLDARSSSRGHDGHRRRRHRAVQPEHRLDRHRRGEHLPQLAGRRGRLQVDRRRQDLAAHGPGRHLHDRAHRHPPDEPRRRLRRGRRATSGRTTPSAASTRRPTAARPGRRSSSSTTRPAPSTWSWTRPTRTRSTPPRGSGSARSGTTRATSRTTPAAASTRRPTAARPGRRSTRAARRPKFRGPHRRSTSACRSPNVLYAFVDNYEIAREPTEEEKKDSYGLPSSGFIKGATVYRSDDKGATWTQVSGLTPEQKTFMERHSEHLRLGVRPDPRRPERREHGLHDGPRPARLDRRRQDVQAARRRRRRPPRPVDRSRQLELPRQRASTRASRSPTTGARPGRTSRLDAPARAVLQRLLRHGHAVPRLRLDAGPRQLPRRRSTSAAAATGSRPRSSRARRAAKARRTPSTRPTRTSSTRPASTARSPGAESASPRGNRAAQQGPPARAATPTSRALRGEWLAPTSSRRTTRTSSTTACSTCSDVARPRRHLGDDQPGPDLQRPRRDGRHPATRRSSPSPNRRCASASSTSAPTTARCT